jgi:hypothetical protein
MMLLAVEIIALFAALLVVFTIYSHSVSTIFLTDIVALGVGWGLISWQLNNRFIEIVCPERTTSCVINWSAIYENPTENEEVIRLNKLTGLNVKWGWLIWSVFFVLSYGLAWVLRTIIW